MVKTKLVDIIQNKKRASSTPQLNEENLNRKKKPAKENLDIFMNLCSVAIMEQSLSQFSMISSLYLRSIQMVEEVNIEYQTIDERFEKAGNFDDQVITEGPNDIAKLQKDIATFVYLLSAFAEEAKTTGTFFTIKMYLQNIAYMEEDERKIMNELYVKQNTVDENRMLLIKEKQQSAVNIASLTNAIKKINAEYRDQIVVCEEKIKYVRKWEKAREEQNNMKLKAAENKYISITSDMNSQISMEQSCHDNTVAYLVELTREQTDAIESWMDKYEADIESRDNELYNKRMEIEKVKDQIAEVQLEYDDRAEFIVEYLEHQRRKREMLGQEFLEKRAAMKIQAWWRNVMFTKKLGPFKVQKGKKKEKGKKKGK